MKPSRSRAFTLLEIILCIAIVAALAIIGGSVYSRVKQSGKADVEISQLHQIGLAANLYHEQYEDWPQNTRQLVDSRLITKEICFSPLDRFARGSSNAWLEEWGSNPATMGYRDVVVDFKNTYLSIGDTKLGRRELYDKIFSEEACGLFISLTTSKPTPNEKGLAFRPPYTGTYRRVLLDGSVTTRTHHLLRLRDSKGKSIKVFSAFQMFCDPSEQWKETYGKTF